MSGGFRSREELLHQVVSLKTQGSSQRAIARALGISRNTVQRLLRGHREQREHVHSAIDASATRTPRARKVDAFQGHVASLLEKYPDITAQRVFEILRAEGFDGRYTVVKSYVRAVRPRKPPQASYTTPEYGPGQMAESDWSAYNIAFTTGKNAIVQAHSYVLVHSTRKDFALYESNDLHALMDGHTRTFARFGGCAAECKYDSQKPVVLRWEGHQPIYNPRFLAFSSYYEFRPVAVRRGHPNDKPRTERSFWELERSFFNGREFRDLEDMRAQLVHWLDTVVDPRKRQGSTALERFLEEAPHLRPLPRHPYDTARVVYRLCSIDGFVAWDGNRYAVPYEHVTDILPVRVTQRELFVYAADLHCVARHELAPRGQGCSLDPMGLHPPPGRKAPIDLDQLGVAFANMGDHAARFFRMMSLGPARVWGTQARQILLLRERYSTEELDAALGHAAAYGALGFAAVERILAVRATPRTLDEYVAEEHAQRIEKSLGNARTEPRDLSEYDRLPLVRAKASALNHAEAPCHEDPRDHEHTTDQTATTLPNACEDTSNSSA